MQTLAEKFDQAMLDIYKLALSEARYKASAFLELVHRRGGVAAAKQLINSSEPPAGYTALFERRCLHLTVEALVAENEEWWELFTEEEVEKAIKRLTEYHYVIRKKR